MPVNVAVAVTDPRLAQSFQVERQTGFFDDDGVYIVNTVTLQRTGVLHPATMDDMAELEMEGQRAGNFIAVYSDQDLWMADGESITSDLILWFGNKYKVIKSKNWSDYGYWKAIGEASG